MISYRRTKASCYIGYVVQAVVNNFLPLIFLILQTGYHITYERLGRLILLNFGIQIAVDLLSVKIVRKIGYRLTVILAHALAATGLVMLGVLPMLWQNVYAAIIVSIVFYASGSGIIEVIISPLVEYLPGSNKAGGMCLLHSFYCWGQVLTVVVTTLLLRAFSSDNWFVIPVIWALIPFFNLFLFIKAPIVIPPYEEKNSGMTMRELLREPRFYKLMLFMLCAGASELAVVQWSSMFAEQALGISKVVGDLFGPCAFAVLMGTGRVFYGIFGKRMPINRLLPLSALLCSVCYIILAVAKSPVLCLSACALCGFSVSLMWPGTYSIAARVIPMGGAAMYGLLAMCGDLGCSVGPWLAGLVADYVNLRTGFLVVSVFPVVLFVTAAWDEIKKRGTVKAQEASVTR